MTDLVGRTPHHSGRSRALQRRGGLRRGRKRLQWCTARYGVAHRLNSKNRRWKYYVRKDGTGVLLANGCAACNALRNKKRHAETYQQRKAVAILGEAA